MNIYLRELKANARSLIIWSVIVVIFTLTGISKFSAYYNNPDMLKMLESLPKEVLAILNTNAFNLTTITGFVGIMFIYTALMLSIAAAMWGSDIIVKEERDKTVEFSLTLPVSRSRVVTAKSLAAFTNCLLLLVVTWTATVVSALRYQPDAAFFKFLALSMLAVFILQLIFLSIGIFLGCALKRYKSAGSIALFILLGTYILSVIVTLNNDLDFLKYLSPFRYFDPAMLLHQSRFNLFYVGLSFVIILAAMVGAYYTYKRRDLYV
jgi:ABC-2 type transport system permease protein